MGVCVINDSSAVMPVFIRLQRHCASNAEKETRSMRTAVAIRDVKTWNKITK